MINLDFRHCQLIEEKNKRWQYLFKNTFKLDFHNLSPDHCRSWPDFEPWTKRTVSGRANNFAIHQTRNLATVIG
jgi:hypothetical protein